MVIRFENFTDEIRCELENIVEYIHNNSKTEEETDNKIMILFNYLKQKNYYIYSQITGLLVSDHYKQLLDKNNLEMLNEIEQNQLDLYSELYDNEDVVNFIESNPEILTQLLYEMSEFNFNDYFVKREMILKNKDNFNTLKKFSVFNIFDYLYYCQKYNFEIFKTIYNDYIQNGSTKEEAINVLIATLDELGISDQENYLEILSELLIMYYMISKYELSNFKHIQKENILNKAVNTLEKTQIREIIQKFDNDKFVYEIIKRILNFDNKTINGIIQDKKYEQTINKLESIKRLVK